MVRKNNPKRKIPIGVKLISIFHWIMAILAIISGLALIFLGFFMLFPLIIIGIFLIALSSIPFFIAINLWKGKEWARIVAIVFAIIGLGDLFRLFKPINMLVFSLDLTLFIVSILILGYLIFNKKAKDFFNRSN
jgi:hypothetical protein